MGSDLIEYIVQRTPMVFLTRAVELLEAAYHGAHRQASVYAEPERPRVLGQLRHYGQNQAIREAAEIAQLVAAAPHTDPKGERYSLVAAQDIRFGRISVRFNDSRPRPSKHRRAIAALNGRLEPVNMSLFDATPARLQDGLGCLLVTVNAHRAEPQTLPAAIMIGVPYSNLRGWHLFEPMEQVLAAYNPAADIEVPDLAWVKLKRELGEAES